MSELNDELDFDYAAFLKRLTGVTFPNPIIFNESDATIIGTAANDIIQNAVDGASINAGAGDDWILNAGDDEEEITHVTIRGGTGNDTIHADEYSFLDGGDGDDRLECDDHSTATGGKGRDTFYFLCMPSQVTLTDFNENDDTLMLNDYYIKHYDNVKLRPKFSVTNYYGGVILKSAYYELTFEGQTLERLKNAAVTFEDLNYIQMTVLDLLQSDNTTVDADTDTSLPGVGTDIPSDAFQYNGHHYYIYSDVCNTWEEAKSYCESLGGHLAIISDAAENSALFSYMKSLGYSTAYFGLSDAEEEGTWRWVNGESATYTNWASTEPNAESWNEDYASFYYKFTDGQWNDGNFRHGTVGDKATFICEWDTGASPSDTTIKKTQLDVIKDFMHVLDETQYNGISALDEAVSISSNGRFAGYRSLIEEFVSDVQSKDADNFLREDCGIILENEDTGAITGWDAGGFEVKTAESIVQEIGDLQTYDGSFTLTDENSGLTLIWNEPEDVTEAQKQIVQGLYSWWFKGALKLVTDSYDMNFKESGTTVRELPITFVDEDNDVRAYVHFEGSKDSGDTTDLTLVINMFNNRNVVPDNRSGPIEYNEYLDQTLAHEFTHAVMAANINGIYILPSVLMEGMAEITHGVDKIRYIGELLSDFQTMSSDVLVNSLVNDTIHQTTKKNDAAYTSGYMLLRYFAKQSSRASGMSDGVHCDSDKTSIALTSDFDVDTFDATDYFSTVVLIDASRDTHSVKIIGNDNDNVIKAAGGGSEITGGLGDDTLYGAFGSDTFIYSLGDGQDVIVNYTPGQDTIKLTSGSVDDESVNGLDVVLGIDAGSITIKNARGKLITVTDADGQTTSRVYGQSTIKPINNVISNTTRNTIISGSSGADSIKNSARNVTINGGDGNDTIQTYGNSIKVDGGAGNDSIKTTGGSGVTLHGGEGADTLTGSASAEVFQYRSDGGTDVITNFGSNDTLHIAAGSFNTYYVDGNDLIVAAKGAKYSGEIRLQNAASQTVKLKVGTKALQTLNAVNVLSNTTRNTIISGTSGADSIKNSARNVTINAGDGNDTIQTYGDSVKVEGGAGADLIKSTGGNYVTLHGGEGDDTITGSRCAEVFQYRSDGGADVITNFGINDTLHIAAGSFNTYYIDGNDLIVAAKGAKYEGEIRLLDAADQTVNLKVGTKALQTLNAVNVISNTTRNTIISGSSGADSIYNRAKNVTINAGNGNDTIQTYGDNVKVEGGADNDSIKTTGGSGVTLHGGEGADTLTGSASAEVFQYRSDGGSDVITNFGSNDTLHIAAGSFNTYCIDGNDLIVAAKGAKYEGEIRLLDAADQTVNLKVGTKALQTLNAVNVISNTTRNTIISGTSGADSIYNYAKNVTINALEGADTIQTYGDNVKVEGGAGNDSIKSTGGARVTLHGGAGDDTLTGSNSAEVFQFRSDGGNDVVTNFGSKDSIKVTAGSIQNYYASGSDYVVNVKGAKYAGTITLKNAVSVGTLKRSGSTITFDTSSSQLPSEEYWFERIDQSSDEINSILRSEQFDRAVDFDPDPISDQRRPSSELTYSARSRLKK